MTRSPRNRNRHTIHVNRWRNTSLGDPNQPWQQGQTDIVDNCYDWFGRPHSDSPFSCNTYSGTVPAFNGRAFSKYNYDGVKSGIEWQDCLQWEAPSSFNLDGLPNAPAGWELSTIAGTNPSRPVVTIPTLAQDLLELPRQIFETGKLFRKPKSLLDAKEAANQFLCIKFGWLPLIDDVRQLLDMQSSIIKRNKELHDLYSGRGLRRRIKFSDDDFSETSTVTIPFYGPSNRIRAKLHHKAKKRVWATIHWRPTTPPSYHPDDEKLNKLATKIAYGLTPEGMAKGLWDVIPWTWMLGWFTNIGKYTLLYSNTVPAEHGQACLMRSSYRTSTAGDLEYQDVISDGLTYSGTHINSVKDRWVSSSVTPGFNMPYLDMSRLSVLGALFVQRLKR